MELDGLLRSLPMQTILWFYEVKETINSFILPLFFPTKNLQSSLDICSAAVAWLHVPCFLYWVFCNYISMTGLSFYLASFRCNHLIFPSPHFHLKVSKFMSKVSKCFYFYFYFSPEEKKPKIKEQVFLDWSGISTSKRSNSCFGIARQERSVLQTGWLPNVATYDTSKSPFADGSVSRPSNHLLMLELRMEVETLGNLPAHVQWPYFITHICCRSVKRGGMSQKIQDLLWQPAEDLVLRPWSIKMKRSL